MSNMGKEKEQTAPEGCPENNIVHSAYRKGDPVLDIYRIESDRFYEGGFGRVYQVHHTGWNVDLAMKKPKPDKFQTEDHRVSFKKECENWINLGLHPHIVSCYYVREIDGVPSIFAEWMDGGSLREWIYPQDGEDKGRLYKGTEDETLERILDISIQSARGLHYANDQGLVHQDVKPDNILLSVDGKAKLFTAKVADFGISDARTKVANIESDTDESKFKSLAVNGYTCTRAYCSPEQALLIQSEKPAKSVLLTARTDIWSWAVTVLEMFFGDCPWMSGTIAGECCEHYFKNAKIPVPEAMKELLRHCFQTNKADRPLDFGEVESELLDIYKIEIGHAYPRRAPKAAPNSADSLNNKALSYLELKMVGKAEECWENALLNNPNSAICQYNYGLHLWKTKQKDDADALRRLSSVSIKNIVYYSCLTKLHIARSDAESAIEVLNEAIAVYGETEDLKNMLSFAKDMMEKERDGRRLYILKGHKDEVASVNFSPDGKYAFTASIDKPLKLLNLETGECTIYYAGEENKARKEWIPPEERDKQSENEWSAKIWEIETGNCISSIKVQLPDKNHLLSGFAFPDGKIFLSAGIDESKKRWEDETSKHMHSKETHRVNCVSYSQDGKYALTGNYDNTLKLWNLYTGKCIRTLNGHTGFVYRACISPDGKLAISGSADDSIKLWILATGVCICTLQGHTSSVKAVGFSQNGKLAISGSADRTAMIWKLPVPDEPVFEMMLSKIQSSMETNWESEAFHSLIEKIDGLLNLKNIPQALTEFKKLQGYKTFTSGKEFFEISVRMAKYCISRQLKNHVLQKFPIIQDSVKDFHWGETDIYMISIEKYKAVDIWNIVSSECIRTLKEYTRYVCSACFSPDGRQCLIGDEYNLTLWNVVSGECADKMRGHTEDVFSVIFSPNGRLAVSGSNDGTVMLWDIITGICIHRLLVYKGNTNTVFCFSPDGKCILFGSGYEVYLWEFESGNRKILDFDPGYIDAACFSPDGRLALFSYSEDNNTDNGLNNTVKLWNIETNEMLSWKGHKSFIHSVGFSPDGRLAFSGSFDKTMKIWEVKSGKCIRTFTEFDSSYGKVKFSPNGQQIATDAYKNEVHIYNLEYDFEFPGWKPWDEGARPYLNNFCALYPNWTDDDFHNILIPDLQNRGYGWLQPEGVKAALLEMSHK